jgi:hypothetical protein
MGGLGGHLVGVQNSSEMAAAIVRALTHRAESSAKSQVAARGLQRFSYEEGKRKFEEVINL